MYYDNKTIIIMLFPDEIIRHINEYNNINNYFPDVLQKAFNKFNILRLVALLERNTVFRFKTITHINCIRKKILKLFFGSNPSKKILENLVRDVMNPSWDSMLVSNRGLMLNYSSLLSFKKRIPVKKDVVIEGCTNLFTVCRSLTLGDRYIIHEILKYGQYRQLTFYDMYPYRTCKYVVKYIMIEFI